MFKYVLKLWAFLNYGDALEFFCIWGITEESGPVSNWDEEETEGFVELGLKHDDFFFAGFEGHEKVPVVVSNLDTLDEFVDVLKWAYFSEIKFKESGHLKLLFALNSQVLQRVTDIIALISNDEPDLLIQDGKFGQVFSHKT